jgi:hypothetical protein
MLEAHTLTEAKLYLKVTACEKCEHAPPQVQNSAVRHQQPSNANFVQLSEPCPSCGAVRKLVFAIEQPNRARVDGRPAAINSTEKRSRIIDVGQWLTLSQLCMQESRSELDRSRARLLNLQAAQCFDEALKFYDDPDNDLPPPDAFYRDSSLRRFREFPQQFSRSRVMSEKAKLPAVFDGS